MPKHPIAVELEAINREGETQVVRDSGLTVQGYSVYLRAVEASRLALAIPLTVLVPEPLMPVKQDPTATAGTITTTN
ncbi:hypothetical protein [Aeromonas sp. HMWF016]|uniref:hypothetical protein n=1 Tax=Aeromonas sp. HMWF016 TaxID=2056852 RepID=UPI000D33A949|nr:hypothetical protein [Aeromonas sp. HMWF016]PTT44460.1 hypothetical protein DBR09_19085 [Aeromonas sp. HMWF016]